MTKEARPWTIRIMHPTIESERALSTTMLMSSIIVQRLVRRNVERFPNLRERIEEVKQKSLKSCWHPVEMFLKLFTFWQKDFESFWHVVKICSDIVDILLKVEQMKELYEEQQRLKLEAELEAYRFQSWIFSRCYHFSDLFPIFRLFPTFFTQQRSHVVLHNAMINDLYLQD